MNHYRYVLKRVFRAVSKRAAVEYVYTTGTSRRVTEKHDLRLLAYDARIDRFRISRRRDQGGDE